MADIINTKMLDKIVRALRNGKIAGIKIGIFGNNQGRDDGENNATIGMFHEFGTSILPQRSFLRVPITEHLGKNLEKSGAFDEETLKEVVADGDMKPWLDIIAVEAEGVVQDAFDTGGYGKWPKSDMTNKENSQTLVETTQLRNSVTAVVKVG